MKKSICVVIIIIVIGIVCGIFINKDDETSGQRNIENIQQENFVDNEETNIEINNVNQIEENISENAIVENTQINTSTEVFEEEPKTEEEKAIQIVKEDYKDSINIKISVEGMDETGRQIVTVRNSQTTEALAFYFVNVSDNTFTKKEMN